MALSPPSLFAGLRGDWSWPDPVFCTRGDEVGVWGLGGARGSASSSSQAKLLAPWMVLDGSALGRSGFGNRLAGLVKHDVSDRSRGSVGFSPRFPDDNAPAWAKAHATGTFVGNVKHGFEEMCFPAEITNAGHSDRVKLPLN